MARLPRTLKKKLEASLENLTPRQAGRLFLIYYLEHDKSGELSSFWDYPPIVDLLKAWERRTNAGKAKGGDIERQAVALHNGFITLTELISESNRHADSELWRLSTVSVASMSRLHELLLRDTLSEIARFAIERFNEEVPRPLAWQEYEKAVKWYEEYGPVLINSIPEILIEDWEFKLSEERGFTDAPDLQAFWEAHKGDFKAEHYYMIEQSEELRERFAEVEGDTAPKEYFKGDKALFDEWVKTGFFGLYQSEWEAKYDELFARLVEKIKAGDLEGGLCYSLVNTWGHVPAQDWNTTNPEEILKVSLPAWAALRSIWADWLYDKGFLKSDERRFENNTPDPLEKYYDVEGTLEGDRLTETAKNFYRECRKKPWGAGLVEPKKVDFEGLGCFLCTGETPLLGYYAPDLGRVAVSTFWETEGNSPFLGMGKQEDAPPKAEWYTTLRGIGQKADELGVKPDDVEYNYIREFYYPTDRPDSKRRAIALMFMQLNTLRVSHRPFTYREKDKREMPSFLGMEFFTPLEEAVKTLGEAFHQVDTFKLTYELLSQEFFDGLPVLSVTLQDRLKNIEETLSVAEARLNQFLDALASPTWNVDTSSLRLVKTGPHESTAKFWAAAFIAAADKDSKKETRPAWLDNGETFEQIAKRLTGFEYKDLDLKKWRSK